MQFMESILTRCEATAPATNPFAVIAAHIEAIKPAHQAAWRGPVVDSYPAGSLVWLWDHYNTAVVVGPGAESGSWLVSASDADGIVSTYEYPAGQLRPAAEPVEFRWSAS